MQSILTVQTAAANRRLVELATLKDELDITGSASDARLTRIIDRVSTRIVEHCRIAAAEDGTRTFARESLVETLRLVDRPVWLVLARKPITSIVSVVADGEALASSDYELAGGRGMLRRLAGDNPSRWCPGKIVVTFEAGWKLPGESPRTLPETIEEAAIRLSVRAWHSRGEDDRVKSETVEGVGSQTLDLAAGGDGQNALPADVVDLLSPYVNPVL